MADNLVKKDSAKTYCPEAAIGISESLLRSTVYEIVRKKQYSNWHNKESEASEKT